MKSEAIKLLLDNIRGYLQKSSKKDFLKTRQKTLTMKETIVKRMSVYQRTDIIVSAPSHATHQGRNLQYIIGKAVTTMNQLEYN